MDQKKADTSPPEGPSEELIVVGEQNFLWPAGLVKTEYGNRNSAPSRLFKLCLGFVKKLRPDYVWIPIFRGPEGNRNYLVEMPTLLVQMENLWVKELGAKFTESQREVILGADCVVVACDKNTGGIVAFGTARYSPKGVISPKSVQTTVGGLVAVGSDHQASQLGPITAALISIYGHSFYSFFESEVVIVRTSNKFAEKILRRAEPVYRSDELVNRQLEGDEKMVYEAMLWAHSEVFKLPSESFEGLEKVTHRVPEFARSMGLREDESAYFGRVSSLAYFLFRVFRRKPKRKSPNSPQQP